MNINRAVSLANHLRVVVIRSSSIRISTNTSLMIRRTFCEVLISNEPLKDKMHLLLLYLLYFLLHLAVTLHTLCSYVYKTNKDWVPTNNHHSIEILKQHTMKCKRKSKKHNHQNTPT